MKRIFKYEIPIEFHCPLEVEVPTGAEILKIAPQGNRLFLWAAVHTEEPKKETLKFRIIGTGQKMPTTTNMLHLETCQVAHLVLHVFITIPKDIHDSINE